MFDKFDTYNFVANLIPGALLAFGLHAAGLPVPSPQKVVAFVVVAFALGAICNRLGALVLDPALRKIKALPPKNYQAYVVASKKDAKLEVIVENANLYRTFATAGILYFVIRVGYDLSKRLNLGEYALTSIVVISSVVVFILAFRREDLYITQRLSRRSDSE